MQLIETIRFKMLERLSEIGVDCISGLSNALGTDTTTIYRKVAICKRHGHITEQIAHEPHPITHTLRRIHKVYITEKGKQWLKEQAT